MSKSSKVLVLVLVLVAAGVGAYFLRAAGESGRALKAACDSAGLSSEVATRSAAESLTKAAEALHGNERNGLLSMSWEMGTIANQIRDGDDAKLSAAEFEEEAANAFGVADCEIDR